MSEPILCQLIGQACSRSVGGRTPAGMVHQEGGSSVGEVWCGVGAHTELCQSCGAVQVACAHQCGVSMLCPIASHESHRRQGKSQWAFLRCCFSVLSLSFSALPSLCLFCLLIPLLFSYLHTFVCYFFFVSCSLSPLCLYFIFLFLSFAWLHLPALSLSFFKSLSVCLCSVCSNHIFILTECTVC